MSGHDSYYETMSASRSPSGQHQQPQMQHPTLHRVSSRQFDAFGSQPGLYTAEDHAARYDPSRAYETARITPSAMAAYGGYETSGAQTWNPSSFGGSGALAAMGGGSGRIRGASRQRSALPTVWTDNAPTLPVNQLGGLGNVPQGGMTLGVGHIGSDIGQTEEELIPTAIVIKNIPFAVKKEQLVQLMTDLNLPLPYAFNYHFDNGVFRGLAFANFTTADETATVIECLNGFDLQGRKLRVEYKKMLPLQERERIEREKRERRGQLEEQHRPLSQVPPLATSPSPGATRGGKPDVDLNDPQTLQFYSQLLLFRDDLSREALIFPPTLSPQQRRIVHTLAHHMGLAHISRGSGESRQVHVFRAPPSTTTPSISPPSMPTTIHVENPHRRGLARATTMDFTDTRSESAAMYSSIGRHASALLDIPSSPSGRESARSLRAAKSVADLRSYSPSPAASTASFPVNLRHNVVHYQQQYDNGSANGTTPTLTPTATGNATSQGESLLVNGLSSMSLSNTLSGVGSIGSLRGDPRGAFERDRQNENASLGSGFQNVHTVTRSFSMGFDEVRAERDRSFVVPQRQPKGPDSDRGAGFSGRRGQPLHATSGRGSGDLDVQSGAEIVVE